MNQIQKQNVKTQIEVFRTLNVDKRIAEVYKEVNDISSQSAGYYTISEFSLYSKKMVNQLAELLETNFSLLLPYQYQFNNDFGNGNLNEDLAALNTYINNNDFTNAVNVLTRLVYYQIINGFWEKTSIKDDKKRNSQLDELESKLNLISEHLSKNVELNKTLFESLKIEKENLELLINTKKKELTEIEGLLPSVRNNSEEINKLYVSSTATNEAINSLLNQQKSNLDEITKKLGEEKTVYSTFQQELKDLKELFYNEIKEGEKKNTDFDVMLTNVTESSKTFEQRLALLNELIGKEGAEKLFNTFNDRRNALDKPVRRWSNIVFGTGIVALVLIVGIFTNFFGCVGGFPTNIDWHYLLINSIKSLPVMIVLLFTIKQYVRERTFQEEYAFRSAIALTVQAYGDIAGSKKEELIMKAITTIYSLPSMMKDKTGNIFGYRSKVLTETLKEMNETLKTIKK